MDTTIIKDTIYTINTNPPEIVSHSDQSLSIIAIIISGLALITSVFWNWRTYRMHKKHNELSVKPLPEVFFKEKDKALYLYIKNCGYGPCIVEEISFFYDNKKHSSILNLMKYYSKNNTIIHSEFGKGDTKGYFSNGFILNKDEEYLILSTGKKDNEILLKNYLDMLRKTEINIKHQDLYENDNIKKGDIMVGEK